MKKSVRAVVLACALLTGAGPAWADSTRRQAEESSIASPSAASRSRVDRRLAVALARMDENLLALLGPATLDCAGDFLASGIETCVVRLDRAGNPGPSTTD